MVTQLMPLMEENEPTNDWVSEQQTVVFECDEFIMRIKADYKNYDKEPDNYSFVAEMPKEEAIKLARGILLSFNLL